MFVAVVDGVVAMVVVVAVVVDYMFLKLKTIITKLLLEVLKTWMTPF